MKETESSPRVAQRSGTLSVVMPVFNGADWVERTIDCIQAALDASPWRGQQIVVVDDGSTDGTGQRLDELAQRHGNLDVVHTENRGRFLARHTGISRATGDFVLLVDCRVLLDVAALGYLARRVTDGTAVIFNGHVEIDTSRNRYARFWQAITFVAWRRYLADPRPVSFGADDFDYYPKGTGCFFAPRAMLLEAYESFETHYDDLRRVNDDTSLIRGMAERERIHIDPRFGCVYHARGDFRGFLTHSFYRGMHFVDGYLRPGNRYFVPLLALLATPPAGLVLLWFAPVITLVVGVVGCVAILAALVVIGVRAETAAWFVILLPAFATVYVAGIWCGLLLAVRTKTRMRRGR